MKVGADVEDVDGEMVGERYFDALGMYCPGAARGAY
jgi:hypothetical protein